MVKAHGEPREEDGLRNHVDLVLMLDIVDLEAGTVVAGAAVHSCLPLACMPGSTLCRVGSHWPSLFPAHVAVLIAAAPKLCCNWS